MFLVFVSGLSLTRRALLFSAASLPSRDVSSFLDAASHGEVKSVELTRNNKKLKAIPVVGPPYQVEYNDGMGVVETLHDENVEYHLTRGLSWVPFFALTPRRVTFDEVAGVDEAKQELAEVVDLLKNAAKYEQLGARIPKGVLLHGPPGGGKTLLARAVAGEAGVSFVAASGSEFIEVFVGSGAARIRALFDKAKARKPCVVFVDEIDAVGKKRGGGSERDQTLNQLLTEMDGFEASGVMVIAATNRLDVLDDALTRAGRFDRHIYLPLPDEAGRLAILKVHTAKKPLADDVDLASVARDTPGASGASLKCLANEAALSAARRRASVISHSDFEYAIDRTPKKQLFSVTAYHHAGKALAAALLNVTKGGQDLPSLAELRADLAALLAGRAAETLVFGADETTVVAASDLQKASALARTMVMHWGFAAPELGVLAWRDADFARAASEVTERNIDEQVAALVGGAYKCAFDLLKDHREILDQLAMALLESPDLRPREISALIATLRHTPPSSAPEPPLFETTAPELPPRRFFSFLLGPWRLLRRRRRRCS